MTLPNRKANGFLINSFIWNPDRLSDKKTYLKVFEMLLPHKLNIIKLGGFFFLSPLSISNTVSLSGRRLIPPLLLMAVCVV